MDRGSQINETFLYALHIGGENVWILMSTKPVPLNLELHAKKPPFFLDSKTHKMAVAKCAPNVKFMSTQRTHTPVNVGRAGYIYLMTFRHENKNLQ